MNSGRSAIPKYAESTTTKANAISTAMWGRLTAINLFESALNAVYLPAMSLAKRFLRTVALVLALDLVWAVVSTATLLLVAQRCAGLILFSFSVVIPFLIIGLIVAVVGWTRVRSANAGLVIALGALVGTVAAVAINVLLPDVGVQGSSSGVLREVSRGCHLLWRWQLPDGAPI